MKLRGLSVYTAPSGSIAGHPMPTTLAEVGARHRSTIGGSLRAAVFGVNDGLISNLSLVLGIAGAGATPGFVLMSGAAGLLAGALSMAAGEYVSVRSQREMYEYQIGLERD
ncbi:MAG: VIT1/CCC1 transporter family protein, partial [Gammaproteobacteria bacterium]|nr:VIT1/CCC1 transporter family protein [Gammaproteobacteria bacterium]